MNKYSDRVNDVWFEELINIIRDVGYDIRMENYEDAKKKIELLDKLLKTIKDSSRK